MEAMRWRAFAIHAHFSSQTMIPLLDASSTVAGDRKPGPEQQHLTSGNKMKDGREGVCLRGCWWRTAQLNLCGSTDNDDLVCCECSDTLDMVVNNEAKNTGSWLLASDRVARKAGHPSAWGCGGEGRLVMGCLLVGADREFRGGRYGTEGVWLTDVRPENCCKIHLPCHILPPTQPTDD